MEDGNMIKYFYLVKFEYFVRNDYKSYFNLGVFSNQRLAKKKVNMSTGLVGFNRYNIDNFKIIKFPICSIGIVKKKKRRNRFGYAVLRYNYLVLKSFNYLSSFSVILFRTLQSKPFSEFIG